MRRKSTIKLLGTGRGLAPPTGLFRAASPFNRIAISRLAGSGVFPSRYAVRFFLPIGSGDLSVARFIFDNHGGVQGSAQSLPGNTLTISNVYVEHFTLGMPQALTIGGLSTAVMADGDFDLQSDDILPSWFGLTKFAQDTVLCCRCIMDIPISGNLMRITENDSVVTECKAYDSGATTCTNINGTGALTFSGTAPSNVNTPSVQLIGKFVNGDPATWLGCGTSIEQGRIDTNTPGKGIFNRALYNGGTACIAGMDTGISGSNWISWTASSSQTQSFLRSKTKYCNRIHYEHGVNSFTTAAAPNDAAALAVVIAGDRQLWTQFRNDAATGTGVSPMKILGQYVTPRTTGTFTDTAGQTVYGPQWDVGGDVDALNVSRASDVGVAGRIDAVFDHALYVRADPTSSANLDYHKWFPNRAADGTHPDINGHGATAPPLRAKMLAVA